MTLNDEEKRNGHQNSNGFSTDKDESAPNVDATIPTDSHQTFPNGKAGASQSGDQGFLPLSVVHVLQKNGGDEQLLGNDTKTQSEKAYNCHTRLEIIVKGISEQKQNGEKTQDAGGIDKEQVQEEASVPEAQSRRSLRQSRASWKAMQLPYDFEKVFNDSSDSDSSSGSSSDSSSDSDLYRHGPRRKKAEHVSSWAESVVSDMKPEDVDDNSPSRLEWLRQKREDNEQNQFLDQLMSMVGQEKVKAHFLAVKARVKASEGSVADKLRLHLVLQGKDGTGKSSSSPSKVESTPLTLCGRQEIYCKTLRAVSVLHRGCRRSDHCSTFKLERSELEISESAAVWSPWSPPQAASSPTKGSDSMLKL